MSLINKAMLFLIATFLCIACNQVIYFPIDVKVPAEVELPRNSYTVLVVDNLPPTISVKSRSEIHNTTAERSYNVDSLGILFKMDFANSLQDKGFCNNVLYSTYSVGNKTNSADTLTLPPDTIKKLANEVYAGMVFSVDVLNMSTNYWSDRLDFFNYTDTLETNIRVGINIFSSNGERLKPTIEASSSLQWSVNLKTVERKPFLDEELQSVALKASINQIAKMMTDKFLPQWVTTNRCYYTSTNKKMLLAEDYIQKSDWINAAKTWGDLYDKEKNGSKLAKLAFNIALANEMTDDIRNATNWVNIAKEYADELSDGDQERLEEYSKQLDLRKSEFTKLDEEDK